MKMLKIKWINFFLEKYFWEIIKKSITMVCEKLNKKNFGESGIMNPF